MPQSSAEDTLFLFITKNLKEPLMECIRECAGEHQTLVIVPVPRGERSALREAARSDRDNVFVLVKEVERT